MKKNGLMTVTEAAEYLGCSRNFLDRDRAGRKRQIPFMRLGRHIRYDRTKLDAFLAKGGTAPRSIGREIVEAARPMLLPLGAPEALQEPVAVVREAKPDERLDAIQTDPREATDLKIENLADRVAKLEASRSKEIAALDARMAILERYLKDLEALALEHRYNTRVMFGS